MLLLLDIERVDDMHYRVTLDRDGRPLYYEFEFEQIPSRLPPETEPAPGEVRFRFPEGYPGGAREPDHMWGELFDYDADPPGFGRSEARGALYIRPIYRCRHLVYRYAIGDPLEFPIVLDER